MARVLVGWPRSRSRRGAGRRSGTEYFQNAFIWPCNASLACNLFHQVLIRQFRFIGSQILNQCTFY